MTSGTAARQPELPPPAEQLSTLAGQSEPQAQSAASDAAIFTAATYAAQAIQFVAGVVQKGLLGPVASGYWSLIQNTWTFFSIAPLGAQQGATRQIPMHRGRGDFVTAEVTAGTAGTFSLIAYAVAGLMTMLIALVFGGGWASELRYGLILLGLTAPLRYLSDMGETIIQSVKRFDVESMTVILQAIVVLTLQTLAVVWLGFYGLFVGAVALSLASIVLWWRLGVVTPKRPAFHLTLNRVRLRELMRFGAPIMIYGQAWLLFQAVDSFIVAGALSVKQLGYYALAVSVTNYILYLPKSIGAALAPRLSERFAQTGSIESIHRYASDAQRLLAYLLVPVAIGAGYFLFPVLIRHALPSFSPAIEVVQIMVAASFFMALMNMPIKVLITAGYRWTLTSLTLLCLVVNAGLNLAAVGPLDLGLRGAAGATALSYFIAWLIITGYSLTRTLPRRDVALHLGEIMLAFVYTYAALRGVDALLGPVSGGLVSDALLSAAELLVFLVLMLPGAWLAERRVRGLSMIWELLREVVKRVRKAP